MYATWEPTPNCHLRATKRANQPRHPLMIIINHWTRHLGWTQVDNRFSEDRWSRKPVSQVTGLDYWFDSRLAIRFYGTGRITARAGRANSRGPNGAADNVEQVDTMHR